MSLSTTLLVIGMLAQAAAPNAAAPEPACGAIDSQTESARKPCHVETSLFTGPEQPSVFSDLKIRSTDLLEASLSVENRGGSITYAPLLYGLRDYRPVLSELRFRVSQQNNLTTIGTGVQYNPLNPRSDRGGKLWTDLWEALRKEGKTTPPAYALATRLTERVEAAEKAITSPGGLRDQYEKAATIPENATTEQLDELRTLQSQLADKISGLRADIGAWKDEIAAIQAAERRRTDSRLQAYYGKLTSSPMPIVGVAYNFTLFTTLAGSEQDANNNGLNDVEHRLKRHGFNATVESRLSERLQVSGLFSSERDRASAEEGTNYANLYGFGATVGGIVAVLDKKYKESAAYAESFFIPSVVLGGSLEYRRCTNSTDVGVTCPDKLERQTVVTAFVDLKVTKATQFRIGAPFRFSKKVAAGGTGTDVGVVTALTLSLGEPK